MAMSSYDFEAWSKEDGMPETSDDVAFTVDRLFTSIEHKLGIGEEACHETRRLALLRTRLPNLPLNRVTVAPSPIHGNGVFATRQIVPGEIITLYPGDATLRFGPRYSQDHGKDFAATHDCIIAPHVPDPIRDMKAVISKCQAYSYGVGKGFAVVGFPELAHDCAYLGHMCNDGASLNAGEEHLAYLSKCNAANNASFKTMLDAHVVVVATRPIEPGDEVLVEYGPSYWQTLSNRKAAEKVASRPACGCVRPCFAVCLSTFVVAAAADTCGRPQDVQEMVWTGSVFDAGMRAISEQRLFLTTSAVVGLVSSIVAIVTYCAMLLYSCVRARLYTVIEVRQRDQLYQWLLEWLAAQREVHEKGTRVFAEVHPEFHKDAKTAKDLRVRFLPIDDGSLYVFHFASAFIWVSHHNLDGQMPPMKGMQIPRSEMRLRITVLGRSKRAVNALFQTAFEHNKARLCGRTEIFVAQPHERADQSHWRRLEPRCNRPLRTVVGSSEPGPDVLLADMRAFFQAEAWYAQRGVPYRRGYLFHGPPGCGKTSFVTAAAGELDCPIYILNLAEPCLSDLGLLKLVTDAPPRSMLLMEDVDAAFHGVLAQGGFQPSVGHGQRDGLHMGQLTFSGLLNALDGVAGQEGKLVIMTSNRPEQLDEALVRPGRVDLRAQFHYASRCAIQDIFCSFFAGGRLGDDELRETSAVFAARCAERALSMASIQGHLMQFRDDPCAAATSTPPIPNEDGVPQAVKQFVVPQGAAMARGTCEGEEE
jgi:hypothetical protein